MGAMSPSHWAIVAVVLVVLFGSKKLPDAARGLGRSMRILKTEVGELQADAPNWRSRSPGGRRRLHLQRQWSDAQVIPNCVGR